MKLLTIDGGKPRLLLVEDNRVNQVLGKALLEHLGCQVDVVQDGADAVSAVRGRSYDLILMDIRMPVMDGAEATRRLRAIGVTVPILALTATTDDRDSLAGLGFTDCILKPASSEQLRAAISKVLAVRRP
jgi:CheY-like chemotaxis protein